MNAMGRALALAQGLWIRRRSVTLPPAGGPTSGVTGTPDADPPLLLGVLGESTAAGCGVATHAEGFTGALAEELSSHGGRVAWHVIGEHGATARRIRHRLMPQLTGEFDVVVILAGANDVLSRRTPEQWREDLTAIVAELGTRSRWVVVTGAPPFAVFPLLPRALARYLAERGDILDATSRAVCAEFAHARFVAAGPDLVGEAFFAEDGFHPGNAATDAGRRSSPARCLRSGAHTVVDRSDRSRLGDGVQPRPRRVRIRLRILRGASVAAARLQLAEQGSGDDQRGAEDRERRDPSPPRCGRPPPPTPARRCR